MVIRDRCPAIQHSNMQLTVTMQPAPETWLFYGLDYVVGGFGPMKYGRIISLSSCSTMWQCQT
jgi:hypothetical protein